MVSDLDVYRSAQVLVRQHGAAAPQEAARRAGRLKAGGDPEGQAVWLRILHAAETLLDQEPPPADRRH